MYLTVRLDAGSTTKIYPAMLFSAVFQIEELLRSASGGSREIDSQFFNEVRVVSRYHKYTVQFGVVIRASQYVSDRRG